MAELSGGKKVALVIFIILIIIVAAIIYQNSRNVGTDVPSGAGDTGDNKPPRAVINTNWTANTRVGEMLEFNASQSTDEDGTITHYKWDFGDGGDTGLGAGFEVVNHTYRRAGTFTVNLTVRDDQGALDYAIKTITIRETDFNETFNSQLTSFSAIPHPFDDNDTFDFTVGDDATVLNITFTIYSVNFDTNEPMTSEIDIEVINPFYYSIVDNNYTIRFFQEISFEFYTTQIQSGIYIVNLGCKSGSVSIETTVSVKF
ncbi:MAG: PKD domain-containing protein [Thermoplasmata archaeon]|nr:MAG: PKD domain-containing protein [Thermoplasmata archaeon]